MPGFAMPSASGLTVIQSCAITLQKIFHFYQRICRGGLS
jgi:hypothetical protein